MTSTLGATVGHHRFIHADKAFPMRDWDVILVRHLLTEGANRVEDWSAAKAIEGWEYQGPGIWVGIEESTVPGRSAVFAAAVKAVEQHGNHVSLEYLHDKVNLPGGHWLMPQPTAKMIACIRELKVHLITAPNPTKPTSQSRGG